MNRPADWRQRELGRDLHHSYIVQAPAGSGKTELLTQRMLGLLAHVENPEEVVAITFTRKAAAEMNHRLVGHLHAAASQRQGANDYDELQPHEQVSRDLALAALDNDAVQGWHLLEQPSRLRIRTIDSLCSELARQLPVLSGLGDGQQVAIYPEALYRKAAVRTMAVIEEDNDDLQVDVSRVLGRYDNQYDRLVDLLTNMLASRDQWIGHLLDSRKGEGFDRQRLEDALRYMVEDQLDRARSITPDELLGGLPRFYHFAISNNAKNSADLEALLDACGSEFLELQTNAESLPHWKTVIGSLLTGAGEMRKAAPTAAGGFPAPSGAAGEERERLQAWKVDFVALLDEHRENNALRNIYNTVNSLPNPIYEDEAWQSLESLMRILLRAALNWDLVMAETGEVDFGEISNRAILSLGHEDAPSDLALRLDYRIQHLLVDEFQDTSGSQVRLLDKLTAGWSDGDGRSLFLVGDPMQSIYRFRKAEVSLFIQAWHGELFQHIQLENLQLSVNFRSTSPIVDWVNQAFPVVMPARDDPIMGAVSYSEANTRPGVSADGTVEIQILPGRDDEKEAQQVVELIGRCDPEEKIAILVRSRNHVSAILAALDNLKQDQPRYRYQAIKFTRLADTTIIKDLVSLTLALIQPADRLAWLATLRAPYIGIDLADLDDLVGGNSGNIILDAIEKSASGDPQSTLSSDGQQRLQRTGPVLIQAVNHRGRQNIRSLVESTWIKLGGPACVENASELDDASTYFDLLDALEQENLPVDRDTLDLRLKDLSAEPDTSASENLQVLTIYSAKGLQFDTVILPGLNRTPANDKAKLLHWFELADKDAIVMSPMRNTEEKERQKKSGDLIQFISGVEKQRQALEDGRLLYVAATRAVRKLYMFAAIKPSVNGDIKPHSSSLLGSLWPAIQQEQSEKIQQAADNLAPVENQDSGDRSTLNLPGDYRRLSAQWQSPEPPAGVQQAKTDVTETQNYIEFSWAGEDARLAGNLVHRILQLVGEQGLSHWTGTDAFDRVAGWCHQQLTSEGVNTDRAEAIMIRVARAIDNCLASEKGRWILEDHADAQCEYAVTTVLAQQPRNLLLDRTFVADGTRWIVDYKTSSHGGGDVEGFLENEAKRYREQLQRYKAAMALAETRPIKTALYFPMFDRFLEVE